MEHDIPVRVTEVNNYIICVLCGGYLIDATTITECLHSFCRTCIVNYLEASSFCPTCDTEVHTSKPLLGILPDFTLQTIVYKLVPELFTREINRRVAFYSRQALTSGHNVQSPVYTPYHNGTVCQSLHDAIYRQMTRGELFYTEDERISLCLEYYAAKSQKPGGATRTVPCDRNNNNKVIRSHPVDRRHLLCPATVTVRVLKKFIRSKFDLLPFYKIDIIHTKEVLKDSFKLLDIAYIYTWRRSAPLRLYYRVYQCPTLVSVPVHIALPSGLRKRCLTCSGTTTRRRSGPALARRMTSSRPLQARDQDSKLDIADEIRRFASRRSRAFKMRAQSRVLPCRVHASAAVRIKQEAVSDEERAVAPPFRGLTVPRCLIRNDVLAVKRRRSTSASTSSTGSLTPTGSERSDSAESSGYDRYDVDDDVGRRHRLPKIFRRRLSDSSWSSAM